MRAHNVLIGTVTFWGALAFTVISVPVDGEIVEQPDFVARWEQLSYSQCSARRGSGFLCDFLAPPPHPELRQQPPPRLYVSRNPSIFGLKAMGLDH